MSCRTWRTQASFGMLKEPTRDAMSWSDLERVAQEGEADALRHVLKNCRGTASNLRVENCVTPQKR
jgi:hypothetical protein